MKLRFQIEMEVTISNAEYLAIEAAYRENWATEIAAGDTDPVPNESDVLDAWKVLTDHEGHSEEAFDGVDVFWNFTNDPEKVE